MRLIDYYKESKNFIISALVAAIIGFILLFMFGGCSKSSNDAEVVSKRVKLELPEEKNNDAPGGEQSSGENAVQKPSATESMAPASAETAPAPAPEAVVEEEDEPEPAVVKEPQKPLATEPEPVKKSPKVAKKFADERQWAVNVASFSTVTAARELDSKLKRAGYNSYVTNFAKDGKVWHRVRVGFFVSREDAKQAGDKIRERLRVGSPWIVKPTADEVAAHIN